MKKIAILQSNYIPWKGYFDMIAAVDEFILYDDAQFTKNDWRNRNKIKTAQGIKWLTVPVGQGISRRIRDVELPNSNWNIKHWKSIENNYRKAKYFEEVSLFLKPIYIQRYNNLSELNRVLIEAVCSYLEIKTKISNSWDYDLADGKTNRLLKLCLQAKATEYVSGPAAKDYIDPLLFKEVGINLTWFNYKDYPKYTQFWDGFEHSVSIMDLLFHEGAGAVKYMKHVRTR